MAKLHENLAVERSLEQTAKKLSTESIKTLGKDNLFKGALRKLTMFDENSEHLNTEEELKLTTTVDENIEYLAPHLAKWYDSIFQKDCTNQKARADVVVGGEVIVKGVPATFLLTMETKLAELRKVYEAIPTLAPGTSWIKDESNEKAGVFVTSSPVKQFKSEKTMDFRIVAEATQYHPADVREVSKNETVGEYLTTSWSGALTPVEKARRLDNLDQLLLAVRRARQRANDAELSKEKIGRALIDFINK